MSFMDAVMKFTDSILNILQCAFLLDASRMMTALVGVLTAVVSLLILALSVASKFMMVTPTLAFLTIKKFGFSWLLIFTAITFVVLSFESPMPYFREAMFYADLIWMIAFSLRILLSIPALKLKFTKQVLKTLADVCEGEMENKQINKKLYEETLVVLENVTFDQTPGIDIYVEIFESYKHACEKVVKRTKKRETLLFPFIIRSYLEKVIKSERFNSRSFSIEHFEKIIRLFLKVVNYSLGKQLNWHYKTALDFLQYYSEFSFDQFDKGEIAMTFLSSVATIYDLVRSSELSIRMEFVYFRNNVFKNLIDSEKPVSYCLDQFFEINKLWDVLSAENINATKEEKTTWVIEIWSLIALGSWALKKWRDTNKSSYLRVVEDIDEVINSEKIDWFDLLIAVIWFQDIKVREEQLGFEFWENRVFTLEELYEGETIDNWLYDFWAFKFLQLYSPEYIELSEEKADVIVSDIVLRPNWFNPVMRAITKVNSYQDLLPKEITSNDLQVFEDFFARLQSVSDKRARERLLVEKYDYADLNIIKAALLNKYQVRSFFFNVRKPAGSITTNAKLIAVRATEIVRIEPMRSSLNLLGRTLGEILARREKEEFAKEILASFQSEKAVDARQLRNIYDPDDKLIIVCSSNATKLLLKSFLGRDFWIFVAPSEENKVVIMNENDIRISYPQNSPVSLSSRVIQSNEEDDGSLAEEGAINKVELVVTVSFDVLINGLHNVRAYLVSETL
ncbi:MAG: hypothetical protein ACTSUW_02155 [Candidatus Heimdallarchaeota archaeon]